MHDFFSFLGRLQGIFFQIFQPPPPSLKSQMVRPLALCLFALWHSGHGMVWA